MESSKVDIKRIGLIDDGVIGFEMTLGPSWINFGLSNNLFSISMIGTTDKERHKGYATHILDTFVRMVKRKGGVIKVDAYTSSGEIYIHHVIEKLAKNYGVRIIQ